MTIFTLHSEPLQEEWQDAYGHSRVAPLPEPVQAALKSAQVAELPAWSGRGISLEKRPSPGAT